MKLRTPALATALLIAFSGTAFAQAKKRAVAPQDAQANATRLLSEINWRTNGDEIVREAKNQGKLIFYMHMLGNIAGTT